MIHDLHIHGITSIEVSEQTRKSGDGPHRTLPYFYRKIIITDDRGIELSIHLFGHRETDLEFKNG